MNDVNFEFADLSELEDIMSFISRHWAINHIYSVSKELLMKDFLWLDQPDKLTIGLAKDLDDEILGIFCFKFYNYRELPDLAGALWKVTSDAEKKYQMIGVRLRQFVINNVKHRFFSAAGAGEQTKNTYKMLRLQWSQMKQYYIINPLINEYKLTEHSSYNALKVNNSGLPDIEMKYVNNVEELRCFDFDRISDILPFKDLRYIENRFFDYPFYSYDVFSVHELNEQIAQNIVVCRKAVAKDEKGKDIASAYRIVDFYGSEDLLPAIIVLLFDRVRQQGDEFLDFVCHGFDDNLLKQAGMNSLNFNSLDVIIPNLFEPLVKKNIPVNCVSDLSTGISRHCRADGDTDRPSFF